jgi:hypothetical protein
VRRVAFALVLLAGSARAQLTDDPIKQGQKLAEEVMSSWKTCLVDATDKYSRSNERAETVAEVALNKCNEWDPAVKKTLAHLLAVKMRDQMPFDAALKLTEGDADNSLREAKEKMKLNLMERVLDNRSKRSATRHRD